LHLTGSGARGDDAVTGRRPRQVEFQRRQREFREDLNLRQNEEMSAIYERVNKIIKQVAESEKYDLILQEAVVVSNRIDLTDKVIKALQEAKDMPLK